MLPEKYAIKKPSDYATNPDWKLYIEHLNTIKRGIYGWGGGVSDYYGYDGSRSYNGTAYWDDVSSFEPGTVEITLEQFKQMTNPVYTPEDWKNGKCAIKWEDNKREQITKFMKDICSANGAPPGVYRYYYDDGRKIGYYSCSDVTSLPIVTIDQLLNNTQKQENKMKTVKMDAAFLHEAYNRADEDVKKLIKANVDAFELTTTEEFVLQMMNRYKGCSEWKAKLEKQFPTLVTKELDLSVDVVNGLQLYRRDGDVSNSLIAVKSGGNYKNKGFYLNSNYNWEIVKDNVGYNVLIPTRK